MQVKWSVPRQKPWIKGQTIQWSIEKRHTDK